jgi:hypothetical protein
MSTPIRSTLSASIGPGLTLLTAASAYVNGPMSTITTLAFVLTVIWGLAETALLSYTPIASIDLDEPTRLSTGMDDAPAPALEVPAENIVPFPDPNPRHARRAA